MTAEATAGQTVALAAGWLDAQPANAVMSYTANADVTITPTFTTNAASYCISNGAPTTYWWPWDYNYWRPWYVPITSTGGEKIKLKSGEVERLRAAAKRDAKLKAVLNKFTPLIEVELEF